MLHLTFIPETASLIQHSHKASCVSTFFYIYIFCFQVFKVRYSPSGTQHPSFPSFKDDSLLWQQHQEHWFHALDDPGCSFKSPFMWSRVDDHSWFTPSPQVSRGWSNWEDCPCLPLQPHKDIVYHTLGVLCFHQCTSISSILFSSSLTTFVLDHQHWKWKNIHNRGSWGDYKQDPWCYWWNFLSVCFPCYIHLVPVLT